MNDIYLSYLEKITFKSKTIDDSSLNKQAVNSLKNITN